MRFLALLAVVAATHSMAGNAPADRYFGKLKMSALRIRYEIMQLRPRYETHNLLPEEAEHLAILDEDAYRAWAASYPRDAWLASSGYLLAQLYEELPGSEARRRAVSALTYVKTQFPNTTYAREAAGALHRGVPIRPDPEWAVQMRAAKAPATAPARYGSPVPPSTAPPGPPLPG